MKICGTMGCSYKRRDDIQTTSRCSILDTDEVISQLLDDRDGLRLLDRSGVFCNKDSLLRFDDHTPVSLVLSVYASRVCLEGEKLHSGQPNARGSGTIEVIEQVEDCLLLLGAEVVTWTGRPNPSSLTQDRGFGDFAGLEELVIEVTLPGHCRCGSREEVVG